MDTSRLEMLLGILGFSPDNIILVCYPFTVMATVLMGWFKQSFDPFPYIPRNFCLLKCIKGAADHQNFHNFSS